MTFLSAPASAIARPLFDGVLAVIATKLCDDCKAGAAVDAGSDDTLFIRTLQTLIRSAQQTTSVIESVQSNEHR